MTGITVKVLNRYGKRKRGKNMVRVGMGYDVHKLTEGRDLILGGVKIPWELGLLGHSDADVVVHAIMDALLGAAALRDIGRHFPDTDPQYKGISSILLLQKVGALLKEKGYQIVNIDVPKDSYTIQYAYDEEVEEESSFIASILNLFKKD